MAPSCRRTLQVNWKAVNGAAHGRRKLSLRSNDNNSYMCPIKLCLHAAFKSSRGLRKHINTKHAWYYYFDEQPEVKREELEVQEQTRKKAYIATKPAFSLDEGIGLKLLEWLKTTCGGGKNEKEARQIGKRCMKFLMHAMGNNETDNEFIDCCLSSASIIVSFLETLEREWKLSSSASLNYVTSIEDLLDFRKAHRVTDNTLRCLAVTEVYLRRAKVNLRKKKNLECNRNLDLETLIAKDSWATIGEMEEVIPFHMKSFKEVMLKSTTVDNGVLTKGDLVFAVRFITALLFLRVKCSRPMTFQFLTTEMVEKAKKNGGFIDQKEFKTSTKYIFDSLIITEDVFEILDLYIEHVRPRLNPQCEYLLLSTNGTQYQSLTTAMTMLVHQAIGKYINPTRYRQIIETESCEHLTIEEQHYISEDQKHSSNVAKIHYKKNHSRKMAFEGKKCMEKLTSQSRPSENLMEIFNKIDSEFDSRVLDKSRQIIQGSCTAFRSSAGPSCSSVENMAQIDGTENNDPYQPVMDTDTDMVITQIVKTHITPRKRVSFDIPTDNITVKKELANNIVSKRASNKNVKFTEEEDEYLKQGIEKYGKKNWAGILKHKSFRFHSSRNRDSLRVRADSSKFKKYLLC